MCSWVAVLFSAQARDMIRQRFFQISSEHDGALFFSFRGNCKKSWNHQIIGAAVISAPDSNHWAEKQTEKEVSLQSSILSSAILSYIILS